VACRFLGASPIERQLKLMTDPAAPQPVPPPAGGPAGSPSATPQPGAVPPPAAPQPAVPAPPLTEAEDKQWASFAHFGGVLGFLPALIIFLVFKDRGARTNVEAKEALNWQITWIAAAIILGILFAIVNAIAWAAVPYSAWGVYLLISGLFTLISWLPYLANLVFSIIGGVKVNGGGSYRYPFALRLIK